MKQIRSVMTTALWVAGLVLFAATTRPFPTVELCGALLLATVAGVLLSRGSAAAIRIARYLVWVNAIGGLVWAMAFATDMFAGAWLAGVCAYGLVFSLERVLLVQSASQA